MGRRVLLEENGKQLIVVDSAAEVSSKDSGSTIVDGSHSGENVGRKMVEIGAKGRIGNDAGIGLNNAGIAGIFIMATSGIPAASVDCGTAAIGVGMSTFEFGKISHINEPAAKLGIEVGMSAKEAAEIMFRS